MVKAKIDEVQSWLKKARQDLEAAAWLLESPQAFDKRWWDSIASNLQKSP